jgi:hypothetical protein
MVFGSYSYVGDRRYYEPIILIVLLLAFYLATPGPPNSALFLRWVRYACSAFSAGFAGMMLMGLIFLFVPTMQGKVQRKKLMGESDLRTFPGFGVACRI